MKRIRYISESLGLGCSETKKKVTNIKFMSASDKLWVFCFEVDRNIIEGYGKKYMQLTMIHN
jgi:hypothetical protein